MRDRKNSIVYKNTYLINNQPGTETVMYFKLKDNVRIDDHYMTDYIRIKTAIDSTKTPFVKVIRNYIHQEWNYLPLPMGAPITITRKMTSKRYTYEEMRELHPELLI